MKLGELTDAAWSWNFAGQRRAVFLGGAFGAAVEEGDRRLFGQNQFDGIPTMVTPRELAMLMNFFATVPVEGDVLEIGAYLGGSTSAIGRGLARRSFAGTYHVIDSFGWDEADFIDHLTKDCAALPISPVAKEYTKRGDFGPAFAELHEGKPYRGFLSVHRAVIPYADGKAEFPLAVHIGENTRLGAVFIDGFKSWGATYEGMKSLVPHVGVGTYLIFQDFSWLDCDWLPILAANLHNQLELEMKVDNTAVFRVREGNLGPGVEVFGGGPDLNRYDEYAAVLRAWSSGMFHSGDDVGHANHTAQRWMLARRFGREEEAKRLRFYLDEMCENLHMRWLTERLDRLKMEIHAAGAAG